jgi:hypothetical protein
MIEMRWLEKETGKTLQNDYGYFYPETEKILQYRERISSDVATLWQNIPIVNEKAQEK